MATAEIAAMLDSLMGRNRNTESGVIRRPTWEDEDVCGHHLVEYCPHDLFVNTKVDLGPCNKMHDDNLREQYREAAESGKKERRQEDFLKFAQRLLGDADTRIKRSKEAFKQRQKEQLMKTGISPEVFEEVQMKIEILNEKINKLVGEAEEKGNLGEVEEARGVFKLAEQLKTEREELQDSIKPKGSLGEEGQFGAPREMEVCEVCGAYVEINVQCNVEDHNNGKMHSGFVKLKISVDAMKPVIDARREAREAERAKEMAEKAANEPKGKSEEGLAAKGEEKRSRS